MFNDISASDYMPLNDRTLVSNELEKDPDWSPKFQTAFIMKTEYEDFQSEDKDLSWEPL
jgi:hypothetical protein